MIGIDALVTQTAGLSRSDLDIWISNDWVRPEPVDDILVFAEIDIARVTLILQLRNDLDVTEAALPVVLSLIDQVYDLRRHVRLMGDVLQEIVPGGLRVKVLKEMTARQAWAGSATTAG